MRVSKEHDSIPIVFQQSNPVQPSWTVRILCDPLAGRSLDDFEPASTMELAVSLAPQMRPGQMLVIRGQSRNFTGSLGSCCRASRLCMRSFDDSSTWSPGPAPSHWGIVPLGCGVVAEVDEASTSNDLLYVLALLEADEVHGVRCDALIQLAKASSKPELGAVPEVVRNAPPVQVVCGYGHLGRSTDHFRPAVLERAGEESSSQAVQNSPLHGQRALHVSF